MRKENDLAADYCPSPPCSDMQCPVDLHLISFFNEDSIC